MTLNFAFEKGSKASNSSSSRVKILCCDSSSLSDDQVHESSSGSGVESYRNISLRLIRVFIGLFFKRCVFLVLIFGNQIPNILVSLLEFHFIHSFTLVPVKESFSPVHSTELSRKPL